VLAVEDDAGGRCGFDTDARVAGCPLKKVVERGALDVVSVSP
jgi:hypothetical protein